MSAAARWFLTLLAIVFLIEWLRSSDHILHIRGPIGDHRTLRFVNGYVAIWTEEDYRTWVPGVEEFTTDRIGLESPLGRDSFDPDMFCIPLWMPMLLAAVPAGFLWRAGIICRRRPKIGLCTACAYDRRGLAANVPCPECGSKP